MTDFHEKHAGATIESVMLASIISLSIFIFAASWANSELRKKDITSFANEVSTIVSRVEGLKRTSSNFTTLNNGLLILNTRLPNGLVQGTTSLIHTYRDRIIVSPSTANRFVVKAFGIPNESCVEAFIESSKMVIPKGLISAKINAAIIPVNPAGLNTVIGACGGANSVFTFKFQY